MAERGGARDEEIGLEGFLTRAPGLGGRLKVRVDDFVVDEEGGLPPEDPQGAYTLAVVRLANWETNRFVNAAADLLRMSRKKIHFSGTKDKRGVTTQAFTFEASPEALAVLGRLGGVTIERAYRCATEAALGGHDRNRFRVVLRDLPDAPAEIEQRIQSVLAEAHAAGGFPNTFGPQRFGALRATTHRVGRRILEGDFRGAVHAYLEGGPTGLNDEEAIQWRRGLEEAEYAHLLRMCRADQGFERALLHRLIETNDPIEALRALPKNLQLLFVFAVQSELFNRLVSRRIREGLPLGRAVVGDLVAPVEKDGMRNEWIPVKESNVARVNEEIARGRCVVTGWLPGTEAPTARGTPGRLEEQILEEAGLTRGGFVVPEHIDWSSKGTRRALALKPEAFQSQVAEDDLHPGRRCVEFQFSLPRGSYATSLLREFMKSPRLADYA